MNKRRIWGFLPFSLGIVLLLGGYFFFGLFQIWFDKDLLNNVFLLLGIVTGIAVPILAYLSYPRVHNLKILIAGYLTGVATLFFFVSEHFGVFFPLASRDFIPGSYLLMIAIIFLSTILPTYLKYRYTKYITIGLFLVEAGIIYIIRSSVLPSELFYALRYFNIFHWICLIPAAAALFALLLSFFVLKLGFYLGGVFGGTIVLFAGGWYLGPRSHSIGVFDSYIFAVAPLFLGIGVLIHWIARMEHRASYDPLLRIYNRSYCEKILAERTRINTSPPFTIAIVDVDRFKRVNDTYGHRVGDELLIRVARILTNELVPEGIVCRYGGDEFVIFFPRKDSKKVKSMVDRVRKLVKKAGFRFAKRTVKVTLSIGISHRVSGSQTLPDILRTADKALYRAKKQGRNQIRFSITEAR